MSSDNGGIIGVVNDPTSTVASGVWQQEEQYEAKVNGTWPQRALFTTKSLRFNDGSSDYLNRTPSQEGSRRQLTFSCWFKKGLNAGTWAWLIHSGASNDGTPSFGVGIRSDSLSVIDLGADGSYDINFITNRKFRDAAAWYHVVVAIDTTQGTESNRVKIYVNGVQETSFSTAVYPSQNHDFNTGPTMTNYATEIGRDNYNGGESYFDGYMAEIILIDGSQLAPTSFGSTNSDGVWIPAIYTGTFGTNGFNLQFEDASSLGTDSSSNGNNFTVNNLTSIDQSTDYPEVNFATFNTLVNVPYSTYSEGNTFVDLTSTGNSSHNTNYGNIAFSLGKWYWEAKALGGNKYTIGLSNANNQSNYQQVAGTNLIVGNQANSYVSGDAIGWYSTTLYKNGSTIASSLSEIVTNDIMMVAVDCDNGKIYFGKNGTWRVANSTTFDATQNDTTFTTGEFYVSAFSNEDCDWSVNWGSPAYAISSGNTDGNGYGNFEYAVPSGYYSLNTKNLGEFG